MNILKKIKEFNADRVQAVLPIKYTAMSQDAFSFFRGSCHLFYEDLVTKYPFKDSPVVWICGDLHIENFGSYKGENRLLYFDMNDFDEAILAPLLYEISRLMVSVIIKTVQIKTPVKERDVILAQLLQQYRNTLIKTKSIVIEKETATGLIKKLIDIVDKRKPGSLLLTRTNNKIHKAKLLQGPRLLTVDNKIKKQLAAIFTPWFTANHSKGFKVTDIGFRIAGTGSIGVKRYLFLLENKLDPKQKKLIDVKQAKPSSLFKITKLAQPHWPNEADRVVKTQEMMQHVAPAFLSALKFKEDWYVAKQLQPTSDKICITKNAQKNMSFENYIIDLAKITASAQLRSSGRLHSATADELSDFAKDETWAKPLTEWCLQYADKVKQDYKIFYKAWNTGYFNT